MNLEVSLLASRSISTPGVSQDKCDKEIISEYGSQIVLTDERFYQHFIQDRIRRLIIYSTLQTKGLTDSGKTVTIQTDLPSLHFSTFVERYLSHVYMVLTQMSDATYLLRANVRGLGGGNDPSPMKSTTGKKDKGIVFQPQRVPQPSPVATQTLTYYISDLRKAIEKQDFTRAMQLIGAIKPSDKVSLSDPVEHNWMPGVIKLLEVRGKVLLTPDLLEIANRKNLKEMAIHLIKVGAPVSHPDALEYAVKNGWADVVQNMLDRGADPKEKDCDAFYKACDPDLSNVHGKETMRKIALSLLKTEAIPSNPKTRSIVVWWTMQKGWLDVLSIVFKQGGLDLETLWSATGTENPEVVSFVLQQPGIGLQHLQHSDIQKHFPHRRPEVQQVLLQAIRKTPEFLNLIGAVSTKIIRLLQGDLYQRLEGSKRLEALKGVLSQALSTSFVLAELVLRKNFEMEIAGRRQNFIDKVSIKLNELLGSSFYFSPESNIFRSKELEDELKEQVEALNGADYAAILQLQKAAQEKLDQQQLIRRQGEEQKALLQQQVDLEKQALEQQRQMAVGQAKAEEARVKRQDALLGGMGLNPDYYK